MTTTPKGLSDEKAARMMIDLRTGNTLRKYGVRLDRMEAYFDAHPEYAREARPLIEANAKAARRRKSRIYRGEMQCMRGHPLHSARIYLKNGFPFRFCVECRKLQDAKGGILKPQMNEKIKAALKAPTATISGITDARRPGRLVSHVAFQAYRRADPELDALAKCVIATSHSRSQRLRHLRVRNETKREEKNDYWKIYAMLPANFPDRDDVVSDIFEAILDGSLRREDVKDRVQTYVTAHNRMFPTRYAKFGDSPLVSLDEVMFEDGSTTRGDMVSLGLWD